MTPAPPRPTRARALVAAALACAVLSAMTGFAHFVLTGVAGATTGASFWVLDAAAILLAVLAWRANRAAPEPDEVVGMLVFVTGGIVIMSTFVGGLFEVLVASLP